MAVNWSQNLYSPVMTAFAVPITVHPVASQADGAASFAARGAYNTRDIEVMAEDGSVFADQETIIDIRKAEFPVLPQQHDRITIPVNSSNEPLGEFEIIKTSDNGGGLLTLVLRKLELPRP